MIRWISRKYFFVVAIFLFTVDLLLGMSVYRAYVRTHEESCEPPSERSRKEIKVSDSLPPYAVENTMVSGKEMMLDNNLFHPKRTRIAPLQLEDKAQPSASVPEKSQLELVGILISPQKRQAFIHNRRAPTDTPQKKWLKEGEKIWGIQMAGISRETVTLESELDKQFTLKLYDAGQKKDRGEALKQDAAKAGIKTVEPSVAPKPKSEPKSSQAKPEEKPTDKEGATVISTPFGDVTIPKETGQAPKAATKKLGAFQ